MAGSAGSTQKTAPRVTICRSQDLAKRMRVYEQIARRARQLFELRGQQTGHDLEDWLRAEAEFLHPVPLEIQKFPTKVMVQAQVPVSAVDELQVSVEPRRILIAGQHELGLGDTKMICAGSSPAELFCVVDLPVEVIPEAAEVKLQGNTLRIEVPTEVDYGFVEE